VCSILNPLIERKKLNEKFQDDEDRESATDLFRYLEHTSKTTPGDPAHLAIMLSLAAIHTTSTILTSIVYKICEHPSLIDELRQEILETVQEHGWTKGGMEKLRLLDSVMKETLRLLPLVQGMVFSVACCT
jgi:cytochrome P450